MASLPPIPVLLGAVAMALALPVLWLAVSGPDTGRSGGLLARLRAKPGGAIDMRTLTLEQSARDRVWRPALAAVGSKVRRLTPVGWAEAIDHRITLAGLSGRWTVERVLVTKTVLGALGTGGAAYGFGVAVPKGLLLTALAGAIGYFLPDLLLRAQASERQKLIRDALPDSLDQLTMTVDAGLAFEGALARTARTGEGPLADELVRVLQEMQIGVARSEALRKLAERTEVPDLRTFVFSVIQAEEYGLPIAQILRVQAAELREKRKARAEERALKIPVKIIFPLVMCIFPTLFIVLLGPAAIRIFEAFGETNLGG